MANVTLVRPAFSTEIYGTVYSGPLPKDREIRPPLGLAYLAASLVREGHKVTIVDGEPELLDLKSTVNRVMATNPDFVGITSTTPEFYFAASILEAVKKIDKRIVTLAGGSHVSALPEYTIEKHGDVIDYVVVAEVRRESFVSSTALRKESFVHAAPTMRLIPMTIHGLRETC